MIPWYPKPFFTETTSLANYLRPSFKPLTPSSDRSTHHLYSAVRSRSAQRIGDNMVSQSNFFRDDVSGSLHNTPAEALESERHSLRRKEYLAEIHRINW